MAKLDAEYNRLADRLNKDLIMEENQLIDSERKLKLEISGFIEENELDELEIGEEVCVFEIKQLKRTFENIHVDLERVLEDNVHDTMYENEI